jgi:hypothetical protein
LFLRILLPTPAEALQRQGVKQRLGAPKVIVEIDKEGLQFDGKGFDLI